MLGMALLAVGAAARGDEPLGDPPAARAQPPGRMRQPNSGFPMLEGGRLLVDAAMKPPLAIPPAPGMPPTSLRAVAGARVLCYDVAGTVPLQRVAELLGVKEAIPKNREPVLRFNALPGSPAIPAARPGMEGAVYQLDGRNLVVATWPQGLPPVTRVRVVELQAQMAPLEAWLIGSSLAEQLERAVPANGAQGAPPPLPPNTRFVHGFYVPKQRLPALVRSIQLTPSIAPEMRQIAIRLLEQANGVQLSSYVLPPQTRPAEVLDFYRGQARRLGWTVLREDASRPNGVSGLYQLAEPPGVVIILCEMGVPAPGQGPPPAGPRPPGPPPVGPRPPVQVVLTVLQLEGRVTLDPPARGPGDRR